MDAKLSIYKFVILFTALIKLLRNTKIEDAKIDLFTKKAKFSPSKVHCFSVN